MYKSLIVGISVVIEVEKNRNRNLSKKELHCFIQGLEVAKQVVEQMGEFTKDEAEAAHETFEETVKTLIEILSAEEMISIIEDQMETE